MAVQVNTNNLTTNLIRGGFAAVKQDQVIIQDAGRGTTALVYGTLMAKISASQKWTPFIDETATDGTAIPQGIYVGGDITGAALVAGDIANAQILSGLSVFLDKNLLTIENSKLLTTVITVGTTDIRNVEDHLLESGMSFEDTIEISEFA